MKTLRLSLVANLVLFGSLGLLAYKAKSQLEVSASVQINAPPDFYQPLASCGSWVDVNTYGHCFRPAQVDAGWRPYCNGSWEWTDSGWYWQSDEPWAWACYHYGTWADDPSQGWIWIPGTEWSPAWVTWRTGGDYIGWAPCAPRGVDVAPALFAFTDTAHFGRPITPASVTFNNAAAIRGTKVLAAPGRAEREINGRKQEVVINNGPDVNAVQKASGRKIEAVPVSDAIQRTAGPSHDIRPTEQKAQPLQNPPPAAPNRDPLTMPDHRKDSTPPRNQDFTPNRPAVVNPPAVQQPQVAPREERPATPAQDDRRAAPQEGEQRTPGEQQRVSPAEQQPTRDKQPANNPNPDGQPQRKEEEKPANPPQQQQDDKDKKDGTWWSPSMLAQLD